MVQFESTRLALEGDRDAARNELRLCNDRLAFSPLKKPTLFGGKGLYQQDRRKGWVLTGIAPHAKDPSLVITRYHLDHIAAQSK